MGSKVPFDNLQLVETSPPPEFFITHIGKIENAGGANLRLYCCAKRDGVLEVKYTCVIPIDCVVLTARQSLSAAADAHNEMMLMDFSELH